MTSPKMTEIRRRFVDGPFGQIHLREADIGLNEHLPLVCLHQSPKSSNEFIKFMRVASRKRHLIAIDNPGHGESAVPALESEATIENYAKSAWAALDALGHEKIDILGHHTGAKVAAEMAWQQPERVRKILFVSALVLTPEESAQFADMFQPIPLDEAGTRFKTMWERSVEHRGPGVSLEDLAASFAENLRAGEAYEWGHHAAFDYNPRFAERVAMLKHEIHVINPKDMLYDYTPKIMPLLKNGTLVDRPDWGFGFMDAFTQEAVKTVEDCLAA